MEIKIIPQSKNIGEFRQRPTKESSSMQYEKLAKEKNKTIV